MPEAVIVSAVRTAVGRAGRGAFATTRADDLAAAAVNGALARVPELDHAEIEDLVLGCAMPEGEQGWNFARTVVLRAGLPVEMGGVTVNRLCASGLEAIAQAAARVQTGSAKVVVAGGAESMSLIPMGGNKPAPNPWLAEHYPAALLTMGLTAERVAKHYEISREDQDAFSLRSHQRAVAAQAAGRFDGEIVPVEVSSTSATSKPSKPETKEAAVRASVKASAETTRMDRNEMRFLENLLSKSTVRGIARRKELGPWGSLCAGMRGEIQIRRI